MYMYLILAACVNVICTEKLGRFLENRGILEPCYRGGENRGMEGALVPQNLHCGAEPPL